MDNGIPKFELDSIPVARRPEATPAKPTRVGSRSPEEAWREQASAQMRSYGSELVKLQHQVDRIEETLARMEQQYELIQASLKELLNRPRY